MEKHRNILRGGIRQKIFTMLLVTIVLIIAAYTAVFLYQSKRVEQLVSDTYDEQKQVYIDNGLEDQYEAIRSRAVASFHNEMFHARNILILLVVFIVAAGMASAFSITRRIIDPLNTITRRVASLGVRNRQFKMEKVYRTGDEIEVLAESFAKQSARTVLYIDQIKKVTAEKERIGAELDMARKIQASQVPRNFDTFCGRKEVNLYASMRPAKEVGGDFYDFFMTDDDHVCLVMADVSGKGVPAALLMMTSKVLIKTHMLSGESPAQALANVNSQLCETNDTDFFVTVWLACIQLSTGKGIAANAGHEHPVIRRSGGQYELVIYKHSLPIGVMAETLFSEHEFELFPGDSLFVYTDGVVEATDPKGRIFGTDRMIEALNKGKNETPEGTLTAMMERIDSFAADAEQFDDITMMYFRYLGEADHSQG